MFSAQSSQKDGRNFFHSLWIRNDQCLIIVHQAQCIVYETIIFILLLILIDENYSLNHILKAFPIQSSFFHLFLRILANVKLFNFPLGRLSKIQPTMQSFLQKSQKTIKLRTTNFFSGNLNLNFRPIFVNLLVKCNLILPVK